LHVHHGGLQFPFSIIFFFILSILGAKVYYLFNS